MRSGATHLGDVRQGPTEPVGPVGPSPPCGPVRTVGPVPDVDGTHSPRYAHPPSLALLDPIRQLLPGDGADEIRVTLPDVLLGLGNHLVVGFTPDRPSALTVDELRHRLSPFVAGPVRIVDRLGCGYVGTTLGPAPTRIQLCGQFMAELDGCRIEDALPGRQGRLLFAYLVAERTQPARRDALMELLWPERDPRAADASLRPLISRLRQLIGERLVGRSEIRLALPADARIDLESARRYLHDAESAVSRGRWREAWMPAQIGWSITAREFLIGLDGEWVQERRLKLQDDHLRALLCIAIAGLQLGASELPDAERAARSLIELAPYRESGYALLMRALEARGEVPEALNVYDQLRRLLREELGIYPGEETQQLFAQLLARQRPA